MLKKWNSLGLQTKLHILIQGTIIIIFFISMKWMISHFENQITSSVQERATGGADGLINGMNMLMLTGTISIPGNRQILLKKMSQSKNVKEVRIIRAKQVSDQYGPGLPEEQAIDDVDREVLATGKTIIQKINPVNGTNMLRVVVPFIAQENFRGTDCLSCHHVKSGSVNGAASVVIDLTEEEDKIAEIKRLLWLGQIGFQVLLSIIIMAFVRILIVKNISGPARKLRDAMSGIRIHNDLSQRVPVDHNNSDIGEIADTFNTFVSSLQTANKRLDLFAEVFANSNDGVIITDADNNIVEVNPAFEKITGYSHDEVIGKNPRIFNSGHQTQNFYEQMWDALQQKRSWSGEVWNQRKSGEIYAEHLSISVICDDNNKVLRYVAVFSDISHIKEKEYELSRVAHYDTLTGIPNRRLLLDRLGQALASSSRSGRRGGLLFIDLDNFKMLNDSLGHDMGDMLLKQVARRLESLIREEDTVARLGGDEFVVVLEGLSPNIMEAAAQVDLIGKKILDCLNQPYQLAAYEFHSTPSIGTTLFNDHELEIEDLFKQADIAMYQAKKFGRNTVRFFDPKMQDVVDVAATLERDLRKALEKQQFQLYYQIQVDSSRHLLGAEALIRWNHPEKGLISPAEFIPMAEETGMIIPIGLWVLETACAQIKEWEQSAATRDLVLAVNISAKQFHQSAFVSQVKAIIGKYAINSRLLKLEMTESMLQQNVEATIATMNELKAFGVQFSMDDFGTGYSSLQYLKRLPINQIKIDQSFVRDLISDSSDRAIVGTIIVMAHSMNMNVIAEGVETAEQQQILLNKGCNQYQGYLFGKPVPIGQFQSLFKEYFR